MKKLRLREVTQIRRPTQGKQPNLCSFKQQLAEQILTITHSSSLWLALAGGGGSLTSQAALGSQGRDRVPPQPSFPLHPSKEKHLFWRRPDVMLCASRASLQAHPTWDFRALTFSPASLSRALNPWSTWPGTGELPCQDLFCLL